MSIVLEELVKSFGERPVVNRVSLEVAEGELFVLLGPSGCGKSTVLRLIAGLIEADAGRVSLHGRDVTGTRPQHRGVGFVFQHYALFRHMTVAANVEFALKLRRVRAADRKRRREELLELVGLIGLGGRYPHQLSGGQQQRVALARALAHQPEVLLLDEPFGALDARIRTDLRRSLRRIQKELRVTTIFVTHDQDEAFELADRIGVMSFGRLLEVGPPEELYSRPQTEFVATFLGQANLMVGECAASHIRLGPVELPLGRQVTSAAIERRVQVLFRPEDVAVKDRRDALRWPLLGQAVVDEAEFAGGLEKLRLRLPRLTGVRPVAPPVPYGAGYVTIDATRSQHQARRFPLKPGDAAWVGVRQIHTLLHPGLTFLLIVDAAAEARAALELGSQITRLAHARLTVLGLGQDPARVRESLEAARQAIGAGPAALELRASPDPLPLAVAREIARQPYDLVIHGHATGGAAAICERLLASGAHQLLWVPSPRPLPRKVLISVAVGEPGRDDVLFAGRLVRHLGAEATLLTVLPEDCPQNLLDQSRRFHDAGLRTLALLDVEARSVVRRGRVRDEILAEIAAGGEDLVVLGTPMPGNHEFHLDGVAAEVLNALTDLPVLIVRARREAAVAPEVLTQEICHELLPADPKLGRAAGVALPDSGLEPYLSAQRVLRPDP